MLPPREGFSPGAVGAVGMMARLAALAGRPALVIGAPTPAPFPDVRFCAVEPEFSILGRTAAYAAAVARAVRSFQPVLMEVHNRPELALALARRCSGLPVSLTLHNDPLSMRGARTPRQRRVLSRRLARVVTVSGWLTQRYLIDLPEQAAPPVTVPNALDFAALPAPAPADERDKVILFAGRVVADKGADLFVRACARALPHLPGWRAEMIGGDRFAADAPDTPFLAALRPEAAEAGVRLLGYRPHAAVLAAMARAAIVVVPSRWPEPFGLTALEAMASGAALICAPRGGLPEVVGDAAFWADPEHTPRLARALHALAEDAALRAALGQAGRQRARQFDRPVMAAALEQVRREILP